MALCISSLLLPVAQAQLCRNTPATANHNFDEHYALVGGQNGTWFQSGQHSKLEQISILDHSVTQLIPTMEPGVVWTGEWNGSQWLISGFGAANSEVNASNPFIYLYDGHKQILAGTPYLGKQQVSWKGGDVFAASYNGTHWLLTGLGFGTVSGSLKSNRMALGLFDGYHFTDLSSNIPAQWDAILYANAWNGKYWLVGGGWKGNEGVLFRYDDPHITDLVDQVESVIPNFHSVQAIGWNGDYWLIGGVGFLVKYDGRDFTDLGPELDNAVNLQSPLYFHECCDSVNAIAWNGNSWMIGGGAPILDMQPLTAWLATYNGNTFSDLSPLLPSNVVNPSQNSSILSITYTDQTWFIGGYANHHGMLLSYANSTVTNLSYLVNGMSTVNWIGGSPQALTITRRSQTSQSPLIQMSTTAVVSIIIAAIGAMLWKKRHAKGFPCDGGTSNTREY
jgi:hypothetical protein